MSLVAGWVLDRTNPEITPEALRAGTGVYDYTATVLAFSALSAVAVITAVALKITDGRVLIDPKANPPGTHLEPAKIDAGS